jgi:hypothetical protein
MSFVFKLLKIMMILILIIYYVNIGTLALRS